VRNCKSTTQLRNRLQKVGKSGRLEQCSLRRATEVNDLAGVRRGERLCKLG